MILASILALFWTLLGSIFDTFSASIFACIFGCHFFDFWSKMAPKMVREKVVAVTFWRPKPLPKPSQNATSIFHWFWIDFGHHFCDIFKVLIPKIKHLAPQGRTKTLQKHIRNATLIFHGFYIDFGSHVGDILKVLAWYLSEFVTRFAIELLYFFYSDFW